MATYSKYWKKKVTEKEYETITKIARRYAKRCAFGFHTEEDIFQEAFLIGMKGLEKYDGVRPLENFLAVHIKNRLKNFKRDHYYRLPPPCSSCDESECDICKRRQKINEVRRNLMNMLPLETSSKTYSVDFQLQLQLAELESILDERLDAQSREDYLRLKSNAAVPKARREALESIISDIINEYLE